MKRALSQTQAPALFFILLLSDFPAFVSLLISHLCSNILTAASGGKDRGSKLAPRVLNHGR